MVCLASAANEIVVSPIASKSVLENRIFFSFPCKFFVFGIKKFHAGWHDSHEITSSKIHYLDIFMLNSVCPSSIKNNELNSLSSFNDSLPCSIF